MLIACSSCKAQYSLTTEEIKDLPFSVLKCRKCQKNIKIAQCPQCKSYYSITFSSAGKPSYAIKCVKCSHTFNAEFPLMQEAFKKNEEDAAREERRDSWPRSIEDRYPNDKPVTGKTDSGSIFPSLRKNNLDIQEKKFEQPVLPKEPVRRQAEPRLDAGEEISFNVKELLSIGREAFTWRKIVISSVGVFAIMLALILYNTLVGMFYRSEITYLSSVMNLVPLLFVLLGYTVIASIIARITMGTADSGSLAGPSLTRIFVISSSVNALLLFAVNLVLILFGELPIVGPVFFSLLFLPIYIISLMIVLLYTIGLWFFPSIIASSEGGIVDTVKDFLFFIRKHNFSLIYTILLMTFGTSLIFAAVYLLHYGALSLTFSLANAVLSEEGLKVFTAVPTPFLRISDMSVVNTNLNLFQSLIQGLIISHHVGGLILGVVFSSLTVLLIALLVSIMATVSARVYTGINRGQDIDDRMKIRLLVFFALVLLCLFLFKKVFF